MASSPRALIPPNSSGPAPIVGASSATVEDGRERLVRNRLRWLEGNWDGKIPPFKPPSPTAATPQWTCNRRRVSQTGESEHPPEGEGVTMSATPESQHLSPTRIRHLSPTKIRATCKGQADGIRNKPSQAGSEAGESEENDDESKSEASVGGDSDCRCVDSSREVAAIRSLSDSPSSHGNRCASTAGSDRGGEDSGTASLGYDFVIFGDKDSDASSQVDYDRSSGLSASSSDANVKREEIPMIFTRRPPVLIAPYEDARCCRESAGVNGDEEDSHSSCGSLTSPGRLATPPAFAAGVLSTSPRQKRLVEFADLRNEQTHWQQRTPLSKNGLALGHARHVSIEGANAVPTPKRSGSSSARSKLLHASDMPDIIRAPYSEPPSESSAAASDFEPDDVPNCGPTEGFSSSATRVGHGEFVQRNSSKTASKHFPGPLRETTGEVASQLADSRHAFFDDSLRTEIDSLKEDLRRKEIRLAAAEATAASEVRRARAAELARDVKEIQIRNLEVRLARLDNGMTHEETHAHGRGRPYRGEGNLKDVQAPWTAGHDRSLSEMAEKPPASTPAQSSESREANAKAGHGAAGTWGVRIKALEGQFRQKCVSIRARAALAGEGAAAVAAAMAEVATSKIASADAKDGKHEGMASRRGARMARGTPESGKVDDNAGCMDTKSGTAAATADAGDLEEYWGSDYCTPA